MRVFSAGGSKAVLTVFALLLLTVSASAQLSLRKALDTDQDGRADFMIFRPANNVWYIAQSGGGFIYQTFGLANEDFLTPGDYDGDGKGDIAIWRDSTAVWWRLNSNGNTVFAQTFGLTGDEPVARDYDGDGKTDLAVVRRSNGAMIWYALRSLDGAFVAHQFGLSTDYAAPGDYDGDLKFDFAVQRPGATPGAQGLFYIQQSLNGFIVYPWGLSNDLIAPGDYDGDGKTDLAVIREGATASSNLVWYVRNSSDGSLFATTFGLTGSDLNVQGDYDGDGRTDVAIWRNTTGTFYVQPTTNLGGSIIRQWGVPNDFPVASYDSH